VWFSQINAHFKTIDKKNKDDKNVTTLEVLLPKMSKRIVNAAKSCYVLLTFAQAELGAKLRAV